MYSLSFSRVDGEKVPFHQVLRILIDGELHRMETVGIIPISHYNIPMEFSDRLLLMDLLLQIGM